MFYFIHLLYFINIIFLDIFLDFIIFTVCVCVCVCVHLFNLLLALFIVALWHKQLIKIFHYITSNEHKKLSTLRMYFWIKMS